MGWLRLRIRIRGACPQNVRVICSPRVLAKTHFLPKRQAKPKEEGPAPTLARHPPGEQTAPNTQVRKRSAAPATHQDHQDRVEGPAHPSNRLVAQLNTSWRVKDDPLQWILQRKKGNPRKKNSGWRGRSFCRTREALLRCIRDYCGEVDVLALAKVQALPEWHPDWDRKTTSPNLDVLRTDQAQPEGASKTRVSQGSEERGAGDQPSHHTLSAHT
jgi:hypothetical protein